MGLGTDDPTAVVARIEEDLRPRWVWWSQDTARLLVRDGVRVATCWDVAAVHRLLVGGWRADPARAWAAAHDLDAETIPVARQPDLFDPGPRPERAGGAGRARRSPPPGVGRRRAGRRRPARLARWAALAVDVAVRQQTAAATTCPTGRGPPATARAESTAELLCAELAADGLPVDRGGGRAPDRRHRRAAAARRRPRLAAQRAARDDEVLRHAPPGGTIDLRNPDQVRSLLRRIGIEVPDTRAWRLDAHRDEHPLVDALLTWRKAERVPTTYGYDWLDEHVGPDGRLRGRWSASDGAAGRMTATVGLHNMPADLRAAVVAEPGHVFVRADLGQIEPRVLAAVSGDARLAAATRDRRHVRARSPSSSASTGPTAKVAVLGAMYGQTTGHGAQALRRLETAYPVAMDYLADADVEGQVGRDVRTVGGRLVRMGTTNANEVSERDARRRAAARGRYARNAMVQGAAAELFKMWAVTVRARRGRRRRPHRAVPARRAARAHARRPGRRGGGPLVDDGLQEAAEPVGARRRGPLRRRHQRHPPLVRRQVVTGRRDARRSPACGSTTMASGSRSTSTGRRTVRPSSCCTASARARGPTTSSSRSSPPTACSASTSAVTVAPTGRRPLPIADYASDAAAVIEQLVGGPASSSATRSAASPPPTSPRQRPDLVTAVLLEDPPLYLGDEATFDATPFAVVLPADPRRHRPVAGRRHGAASHRRGAGRDAVDERAGHDGRGERRPTPSPRSVSGSPPSTRRSTTRSSAARHSAASTRRPTDPRSPASSCSPTGTRARPSSTSTPWPSSATSPTIEVVRITGVGHLIHDSRTHARPLPRRGPPVPRHVRAGMIVDPHHHLWEHAQNPYMTGELRADTGSVAGVAKTVFVECASAYRTDGPEAFRPVGETEFVVAADPDGFIAGIIGFADLTGAGDRRRPGRPRGRRSTAGSAASATPAPSTPAPTSASAHTKPPPGLLGMADFRRGVAALGAAGLSFEAWMYHPQLPELTALARDQPDVTIVLDHLGGPLGIGPYAGRRDEVLADVAGLDGRRRHVPERRAQARRHRHADLRDGLAPPARRRDRRAARRGVGRADPLVHRAVRRRPLHVRVELPRRQGLVQLRRAVGGVRGDRRRRQPAEHDALFHGTATRTYRI